MATDNLLQVLQGYDLERIPLEVRFLNQALVAATDFDNHECIGKLIKMGATDITKIDECIQLHGEREKLTKAVHYKCTSAIVLDSLLKIVTTVSRLVSFPDPTTHARKGSGDIAGIFLVLRTITRPHVLQYKPMQIIT